MGIRHRVEQDMEITTRTTAQAYAKAVAIENFLRTKMAMCVPPVTSYSPPNQDYVPVKFRLASAAVAPSATMQVQAVQDVLAVQEQMLGWVGHEGRLRAQEEEDRESARKARDQEQLQTQDKEMQEEARHLQELTKKHEEVMRRMPVREKSSQAAEQRRADHAEERIQEELREAQWQASSMISDARKPREEADRRMVEVCAIWEAVAYVPEDGDRFGGVQGVGGAYRGDRFQGRQDQRVARPSYYEDQRGGHQGGPKGGKGYQGGKGKGKTVRTG